MPPRKKAADALSNNPNTIKERKRRANKTGFDKLLLKTKRQDSGAIDYAKKKAKSDPEFLKKTLVE